MRERVAAPAIGLIVVAVGLLSMEQASSVVPGVLIWLGAGMLGWEIGRALQRARAERLAAEAVRQAEKEAKPKNSVRDLAGDVMIIMNSAVETHRPQVGVGDEEATFLQDMMHAHRVTFACEDKTRDELVGMLNFACDIATQVLYEQNNRDEESTTEVVRRLALQVKSGG